MKRVADDKPAELVIIAGMLQRFDRLHALAVDKGWDDVAEPAKKLTDAIRANRGASAKLWATTTIRALDRRGQTGLVVNPTKEGSC